MSAKTTNQAFPNSNAQDRQCGLAADDPWVACIVDLGNDVNPNQIHGLEEAEGKDPALEGIEGQTSSRKVENVNPTGQVLPPQRVIAADRQQALPQRFMRKATQRAHCFLASTSPPVATSQNRRDAWVPGLTGAGDAGDHCSKLRASGKCR